MTNNPKIPDIVIGRLPIYLRALTFLAAEGQEITSSHELGSKLGISSAQIRKDLSHFGEFGKQGTGYNIAYLRRQLQRILQVDRGWEVALNRLEGPTVLVFSRQGMPAGGPDPVPVDKGAYVVRDGSDAVLVATGSELEIALGAADILAGQGMSVRVVSMPCREAFVAQDEAYRSEVLGDGIPAASLEAAVTFGWSDIIGSDGLAIGLDRYGASAPAAVLAEEFGFTAEKVAAKLTAWLG